MKDRLVDGKKTVEFEENENLCGKQKVFPWRMYSYFPGFVKAEIWLKKEVLEQ